MNTFQVVSVSGSPAARSRSACLLAAAEKALRQRGFSVRRIDVRELPPAALMLGQADDAALAQALAGVAQAQAVLIATPLYQAAYSGLLKTFLDLLPRAGLSGKPVLALASGGSLAHLLALDYALKPVLAALGARHVLDNVFATEHDMPKVDGDYVLGEAVAQRLGVAVDALHAVLDDGAVLRRLRGSWKPVEAEAVQAA